MLLVLVLALIFMTIIGRSMVRPLRRLRAGALEVAGERLPETVRRMSETDGEGVLAGGRADRRGLLRRDR